MEAPLLAVIIVGYGLGSIPVGPLLGRIAGVDVQSQGSGNTGATNVARTVGKGAGLLTLAADALKGAAAVLIAQHYLRDDAGAALAGLAAVCGHSFSIFLKFRGGKGVATAFGVFLPLAPFTAIVSLTVFVGLALTTHIASLASIGAAAVLPITAFIGPYPRPVAYAALAVALFVIIRHRDNLRRLVNGTEPTFRSKSQTA